MSRHCVAIRLFPVLHWGRCEIVLALVVLLALVRPLGAEEVPAQDARSTANGSVSGRVTIQGKPAQRVVVGLFKDEQSNRDDLVTKTTTDSEGRFQFSQVEPNHYWLRVLSANVSSGDRYSPQGRRVTLRKGESFEGADWDVIPGGAISGRVMDVDGNPVTRETIHLFPVFGSGPAFEPFWFDDVTSKTDETGAYRVLGISPGRYVVGIGEDVARLTGAVRHKNDPGSASGRVGRDHYYEQTIYPGVGQREQSQVIEVSAGGEVTGINFTVNKMHRAYRVSGRVIDARTGNPVRECQIEIGYTYGTGYGSSYGVNGPSDVSDNGDFSFPGFLPGRFFVNARFSDESALYGERVDFEVKDGDVDGIVIKAYRGLTVRGTVVIEGSVPMDALAKRSQLKLKVTTPDQFQKTASVGREVAVGADGTFTIIGLPRGPVEISAYFCNVCKFFAIERLEYTKTAAKNEIHVAEKGMVGDSRIFDVEGNMQRVRLVLRYKAASILCHVNVIGTLPPQIRLMVSIDSGIGKGGWVGSRDVDANGNMLITGLEPGNYDLAIGDGSRHFTKTRRVTVTKNQQTEVSFTVDASKIP